MTINLPKDLERSVLAEVHSGHFVSADEVIAEAVRVFFRQRQQNSDDIKPARDANKPGLGLIGALRDDAELLDQVVEHAMKVREERPWRLSPGE